MNARRNQENRTWVQETDDYLEKGHLSENNRPSEPTRSRLIFEPAAIALMVGCVAVALNEFLQMIIPDAQSILFVAAPIVGAFSGYRSWITTQRKLLDGMDRLRKQIIELSMLFLLIKFVSMADETLPTVITQINGWLAKPITFFDSGSVTAFLLTLITWFTGIVTARDLTAIHDPALYAGETGPMPRLTRRFLYGGVALLIFTTMGRVSVTDVVMQSYDRISGSKLNILVYFVAGLVMLGQLRYARLASLWRKQNVTMSTGLQKHWLWYSIMLIVGITLIALLLPTGYAIGFMDIVGYIFALLGFLITMIYFLISIPLVWLFSLFLGGENTSPPPLEAMPTFSPPEAQSSSSSPPWLQVLQSLIFWIVGLVLIVYILRSYLRDHPNFLKALRKFQPIHVLIHFWSIVQRWWYKTIRRLRSRNKTASASGVGKKLGRANIPGVRSVNPAGRNAILNAYYDTLDNAHKQGISRRPTQTPDEYRPHLQDAVEPSDAVQNLTDLFIKAHYSLDDISPEDVAASKKQARTIRDALNHRDASTENKTSPDE